MIDEAEVQVMVDVALAKATAVLTDDEAAVMDLTGKLAGAVRRVIEAGGDPSNIEHDWVEMGIAIHTIQRAIMSNVAARAMPGELRALGATLRDESCP